MWNGPKLFPTDPTSLLSQEPEASMRRRTRLSHFLNKIQWPEIKFPVFMPQAHFYYLNNIPNPFFLVLFPPSLLVTLLLLLLSHFSRVRLCVTPDGSPPGSPVPGILQARTLEWVAISFPNAWKWKVKVKSLNRVRLLATPWTAAYQAPQSVGFSRQEYWSGVPLLSLSGSTRQRLKYLCWEI